jgi:RNA polymerase sigma factor (sigma-70 family)
MDAHRSEALELLAQPGWAWRLAHALCRDEAEAEDALGEARLAALRGAPASGDGDSLRAWVARVVRYAVRRGRRGERRRAERESQAARDEALPPAERVLEREEARRALVHALLALPEPYRATLIAHYYDGQRPNAIAARAGLPPSTVRNRLARGRALVRRELERSDAREPRDWLAAVAPLLVRPEPLAPLVLGGLAVGTKTTMAIGGAAALALMGSLWWWSVREPQLPVQQDSIAGPAVVAEALPEAPASAPVRDLEPGERAVVSATDGAEAQGFLLRVVDADGVPQAAAHVAWADASILQDYRRASRTDESTDLESLIAESARSAEADAAGELRLQLGAAALVVSARSGDLWGWVQVVNPSPEPTVLVLEPSRKLAFEVIDSHGAPAAGVPVALIMVRADGAEEVTWKARTGVDGRVVLPRVEESLRRSGIRNGLAYAALLGPLSVDRVALDTANLPRGPVRFVLPPVGSLRVRLAYPEGVSVPSDCWVHATELRPRRRPDDLERGERHSLHTTPQDGRAEVLWTHVELGLDLLVDADRSEVLESASSRVRGPTREGEEVLVELDFGTVASILSGRLAFPAGAPAHGLRVEMYLQALEGDGVRHEYLARVTPDDDGDFQAPVEAALRGVPSRWRLSVSDGRGLELAAPARTLVPPREGVLDLGVVQLEEPATFVAGQVVDVHGAPVAEVQVSVARWTRMGGEGAPEMWNWESGVDSPNTDADGRFHLFDDPPPGRFAVAARVGNFGFGEFVPFERGAREVVIRLPALGGLAGRLLLPQGVDTAALRVSMDPQAESDSRNLPALAPRPDGSFEFNGLEAGLHRAAIRRVWDPEDAPLVALDGVRVSAGGPSRDARLDPLDLRGALHPLELEIVDPEGHPVTLGHVALTPHAVEGARCVRLRIEDGFARLCGAGRSSDVEVEAPGFRSTRFENVRGAARLELERGFEVRVRVPDSLALPPEGAALVLGFHFADAPRGASETVLDVDGNYAGWWDGGPYVERALDADREVAVLLPRHGAWNAGWILIERTVDGSGRSWGVRAGAANHVLAVPADGAPVDVLLWPDPEDLERALRELERK